MFTRDDLIDLITSELKAAPIIGAGTAKSPEPETLLRGRVFLSEYDIKRLLTAQGQHLTIPRDAIISPLASDWLILKGIKIIRE